MENTEIERKYLLKNDEWKYYQKTESTIKQYYFGNNKESSFRIRIYDESYANMCFKRQKNGLTNHEIEFEIPLSKASPLIALLNPLCIEKKRFNIMYDNKVIEVDVFYGANEGLIVAEIELETEDEEVMLPSWIGLEVTGQKKYNNKSLTKNPYKDWV